MREVCFDFHNEWYLSMVCINLIWYPMQLIIYNIKTIWESISAYTNYWNKSTLNTQNKNINNVAHCKIIFCKSSSTLLHNPFLSAIWSFYVIMNSVYLILEIPFLVWMLISRQAHHLFNEETQTNKCSVKIWETIGHILVFNFNGISSVW